jgi:type VI secretion system secreted protein Hcp
MAFDMHLKFGSGAVTIQGASAHSKHKNQVPIIAWSWGCSNTGNLHTGAGYASGGKANIQDITVTKYVDACSNALLQATT